MAQVISFVMEPLADELMFSYLNRLAKHNGLQSVSKLLNAVLFPNVSSERRNKMVLPYDANTTFHAFSRSNPVNFDQVQFYLDHSIYRGIAPFLSRGQQTHMVNNAFRPRTQFPELLTKMNSSIRALYICPICAQRDTERYGFWYYHTRHHMPGMKVCYEHGCTLQKYSGIPLHEMDGTEAFHELEQVNLEVEQRYAGFAADFYDAAFDTDIRCIARASYRRMREKGYTFGIYDEVAADIHEQGIGSIFPKDIANFLRVSLRAGSYVNPEMCLATLLFLFDDVQNLHGYIATDAELTGQLIDAAINEYDIFEPYRTTILEMRRRSTGERFVTTANGFIAGWREVSADEGKNSAEKFSELFGNTANETYKQLSEFRAMNRSVNILHAECGSVISPRVKAFLEDGRRCKCEGIISFEEASALVEAHSGFHLISYTRSENECTILHDVCGETFTCRFRKFLKSSRCRFCARFRYKNGVFEQHVRKLVGEEYTILTSVEKATDFVGLRHEVCGTVQSYMASRFLGGQRCAICHQTKLSPQRPATKQDVVLEYLYNFYDKSDLIFLEDITPEGMECEAIKSAVLGLHRKGKLFRLKAGVYSLDDQILDAQRYIQERYIIRQGHRIGTLYGQSLAYELGILTSEPDTIYIMTNKESLTHGRKRTVMDTQIRIKGCEFEITDGNYRLLQIIDMLRMRYRFGWPVYGALIQYVQQHDIRYDDFSLYIGAYAEHVHRDLDDLYSMMRD